MSEISTDNNSEKVTVEGDIYLSDLGKFKTLIEETNKKAKKLQCPPVTFELGDIFLSPVMIRNSFGEYVTKKIKMISVKVFGEIPRIPGFFPLARIEKTNTECLISPLTTSGKQFDESWRSHDMHCDHCGAKRNRNSVWIIKEESSGKELSIGDSCIDEFLPRFNTKSFINRCSLFIDLKESMKEWGEWDQEPAKHIPRKIIIAMAIAVIKKQGFHSAAKAQESSPLSRVASTAEIVSARIAHLSGVDASERQNEESDYYTQEDMQMAMDALDKRDEILSKALPDNESLKHNLSVVLDESSGISSVSEVARLCLFSKFACEHFLISTTPPDEAQKKVSKHVGVAGEKITAHVKVTKKVSFDKFDGSPGMAIIMEDAEGNILVTYPSRFNPELGSEMIIKGTVKSHKTFRGECQTNLIRVATVSSVDSDQILEAIAGLKHEEVYDYNSKELISSSGYFDDALLRASDGAIDRRVVPFVFHLEGWISEGKRKGEFYFELSQYLKKVQLELKVFVFVEWEVKGSMIIFKYEVLRGKPKNLSKSHVYE